jgi:hypothetical protein
MASVPSVQNILKLGQSISDAVNKCHELLTIIPTLPDDSMYSLEHQINDIVQKYPAAVSSTTLSLTATNAVSASSKVKAIIDDLTTWSTFVMSPLIQDIMTGYSQSSTIKSSASQLLSLAVSAVASSGVSLSQVTSMMTNLGVNVKIDHIARFKQFYGRLKARSDEFKSVMDPHRLVISADRSEDTYLPESMAGWVGNTANGANWWTIKTGGTAAATTKIDLKILELRINRTFGVLTASEYVNAALTADTPSPFNNETANQALATNSGAASDYEGTTVIAKDLAIAVFPMCPSIITRDFQLINVDFLKLLRPSNDYVSAKLRVTIPAFYATFAQSNKYVAASPNAAASYDIHFQKARTLELKFHLQSVSSTGQVTVLIDTTLTSVSDYYSRVVEVALDSSSTQLQYSWGSYEPGGASNVDKGYPFFVEIIGYSSTSPSGVPILKDNSIPGGNIMTHAGYLEPSAVPSFVGNLANIQQFMRILKAANEYYSLASGGLASFQSTIQKRFPSSSGFSVPAESIFDIYYILSGKGISESSVDWRILYEAWYNAATLYVDAALADQSLLSWLANQEF